MKQFYKILAMIVAMFLLLSLTVLPVLADEGEEVLTTTEEGSGVEVDFSDVEFTDEGEGEDVAEAPDATDANEANEETDDAKKTDATEETDTPEVTATGADDVAESKGLSTTAIVWIVVGGVILVAGVVLCIIFREKVGKFFRVYKSEIKKVVWLPWDQTCKSTLVVLVILLVCAAAICLIDLGLSKGFLEFLKLFKKA